MTKAVRIENADNNNAVKLRVRTYEKGANGAADVIVTEVTLHAGTQMTEQYIHSSRYIVVDEIPAT